MRVRIVPYCRPESRIAVVSHADFIQQTLSLFAAGLPKAARESLTEEFANCEMRTVVLSDASSGSAAQPDPLHFPGGRAWQGAH